MSKPRDEQPLTLKDLEYWAGVISITGIALGVAIFWADLEYRKGASGGEGSIYDRIEELSLSLNYAADTISLIEIEVEKRRDLVVELEEKADLAQKLSETNTETLEAISFLFRDELERDNRSDFWWSVLQNFIFMVLGAFGGHFIEAWLRRKKVATRSPG